MADFENGLPPQGIDISDKKISSIVSDWEDTEIQQINTILIENAASSGEATQSVDSILIDKLSLIEGAGMQKIDQVLLDKKEAGLNYGTFL